MACWEARDSHVCVFIENENYFRSPISSLSPGGCGRVGGEFALGHPQLSMAFSQVQASTNYLSADGDIERRRCRRSEPRTTTGKHDPRIHYIDWPIQSRYYLPPEVHNFLSTDKLAVLSTSL